MPGGCPASTRSLKRPLAARKAILSRPISIRNVDAKCDAISTDRIDVLTRAVILVAGMNLVEAERAEVLARVVADLTSQRAAAGADPHGRLPVTSYFLNEVLRKRPSIKPEWCVFVIGRREARGHRRGQRRQ